MKKTIAMMLLAAGTSSAGAQLLMIPADEPRLAYDESAELLFIPDEIAGPLPDSGKEPMPRVAPRKARMLLFQEQPTEPVIRLPDRQRPESAVEQTVEQSLESRFRDLAELPAGHPADFDWPVTVAERDWQYIIIHHSATTGGSVEAIHREHSRRRDLSGRPWLGIGYHFVIGNGSGMDDGETQSTFRWDEQIHGAHSGSIRHNGSGIGICVIGNFETQQPSAAQKDALVQLVSQLAERYDISADRVIGHREIRETVCPGRHFPLDQVVRDSVGQDSPRSSDE